MTFHPTPLQDAWLIELDRAKDRRGWFARAFCADTFREKGLNSTIAQINISRSLEKYTLRGFHYQLPPAEEAKTVRCIRGRILDVIIDLRPHSPSRFGHYQVELSQQNHRALYVPEGFAHAFLSLEERCEVLYQVSHPYQPEREAGIRWNDPFFGISWPTQNPILSEKDRSHPDFFANR